MDSATTYLVITIVALALAALLIFVFGPKPTGRKLTSLGSLAFVFVIAGMFFRDNHLVGYGVMAVGIIIAIVDMIKRAS